MAMARSVQCDALSGRRAPNSKQRTAPYALSKGDAMS